MSRRYCRVCGESHNNPDDGLCDRHREEEWERERLEAEEDEKKKLRFMNLSVEDRWEVVYEHIKGEWDGW